MKKILFCSALVACVLLGMLIHRTAKPSKPSGEPIQRTPTEAELMAFWTNHISAVIFEIPRRPEEILVNRFTNLLSMISKRYGKKIFLDRNLKYNPDDKLIQAQSSVAEQTPIVTFRLRAIWDTYKEYEDNRASDTNWYGRFQVAIVNSFMHELEHLGNGLIGDPASDTFEKRIYRERLVWGYQCEYTIRPIYERSPQMVDGNSLGFYREWLKANRDAEDPHWKDFIRRSHSSIKKIYK